MMRKTLQLECPSCNTVSTVENSGESEELKTEKCGSCGNALCEMCPQFVCHGCLKHHCDGHATKLPDGTRTGIELCPQCFEMRDESDWEFDANYYAGAANAADDLGLELNNLQCARLAIDKAMEIVAKKILEGGR